MVREMTFRFPRWHKSEPDESSIEAPLKNNIGMRIGEITINSDGTFSGEITSGGFYAILKATAEAGFVDGIQMQASVIPATPPWKKEP